MIVNVRATHSTTSGDGLSRYDLLAWLNNTLQVKFAKVEHLCTGAAYCQLMHALFPDQVTIRRVKLFTNTEHDFFDNFKLLQTNFQKLGVQKAIPIDRLIKGRFQDNIEFLQWFKKFYEANVKPDQKYDPIAARRGAQLGYGVKGSIVKNKEPKRVRIMSAKGRVEPSSKSTDSNAAIALQRALTKIQLTDQVAARNDHPGILKQKTKLTIDYNNGNNDIDDISSRCLDDIDGDEAKNIDDTNSGVLNTGKSSDSNESIAKKTSDGRSSDLYSMRYEELQRALFDSQAETIDLKEKLQQMDFECQEARGKLTSSQKARDKLFRKLKQVGLCIKEAEDLGFPSVETLKIANILLGNATTPSKEDIAKKEEKEVANEIKSMQL